MADTLRLDIVTPEGVAISQDAESVSLPATEGRIGVLPHHVHLMALIVPGEIGVRTGTREDYFAVGEGIAEITARGVTLVTDMAVAADRIDEARVEEARERAAARLREKISGEEVASVNASLARSLVQLRVKRRRRP